MICITDNVGYANKILGSTYDWQLFLKKNTQISLAKLTSRVFKSNKLLIFEIETLHAWNYLLITKNSEESQFDILNEISRNNSNLPDGILCIADSGNKFHGYRNRQWQAQSGNLHLSIFKKPNRPIDKFHIGFTILAAVSVVQTINHIPGLNNKAGIKWVNDILINDDKISGVIAQTQSQQDTVTGVVLGIGLNIEKAPIINNDNFVGKSTSLYEHVEEQKINISDIFFRLIERIDFNYHLLIQAKYQQLLKIYREKSIILNRQVEIYSDALDGKNSLIASGKVKSIGDELELYIEDIDKPIRQGRLKFLQ